MIRFFWRALHWSWEITTSLNFPNPVVIPYTTFSSSTNWSTTFLDSIICCFASWANSILACPRQMAVIWSSVRSFPVIIMLLIAHPLFLILVYKKLYSIERQKSVNKCHFALFFLLFSCFDMLFLHYFVLMYYKLYAFLPNYLFKTSSCESAVFHSLRSAAASF